MELILIEGSNHFSWNYDNKHTHTDTFVIE